MTFELLNLASSRFYALLHTGKFAAGNALVDCGSNSSSVCDTGFPKVSAGSSQLHNILSITFAIVAALSVLMIVIAGFRFITAQGNPQEVAKARSTILYALIGLIVSLGAEAIVGFALGKA